jgi:hypothetical protein
MAESQAMKRLTAIAIGLTVAASLAACGSSSTNSSVSSTTAAASTTTTSATGTTSATPGSSTTTAAGAPACVAADLALSYLGGQGATGHGELGFALRNTSSQPCHTYGYPGVLFLSKSGQGLTTATTRTTHDFFGTAPLTAITLAPGETASFRLGVTHGAASSAGCVTAAALQVIPPDDTATLKTSISDGGAFECGTATVSPLEPGTSAYR